MGLRGRYSIRVMQHDQRDCAAASVASICAYWGLKAPISLIRELSQSGPDGTNLKELVQSMHGLGFESGAYRGSAESLFKIPLPAILHLQKKGGSTHFVVLYKISHHGRGKATIMDPADGRLCREKVSSLLKRWSGYLVVAKPGELFQKGSAHPSLFKEFTKMTQGCRFKILLSLLLSALFVVISLLTAQYIKEIIDILIPSGNLTLIAKYGTILLFATIISLFLNYVRAIILAKTGIKIEMRLINELMNKIVRMPAHFFDRYRDGELASRFGDISKIRTLLTDTLLSTAISVITTIASLLFLLSIEWKLALITLITIPLYFTLYKIFDSINARVVRRILEEGAALESSVIETIRNYRTIRLFMMEQKRVDESCNIANELNNLVIKAIKSINIAGISGQAISRALSLAILWAGAIIVIGGEITTGELLSFFTISALVVTPLSSILESSVQIREGTTAASRLFEITRGKTDPQYDYSDNNNSNSANRFFDFHNFKEISINNLSYSYRGRERLFHELNFSIPKGKITAITGKSGTGKSTLVMILARILTPTSGSIIFDKTPYGLINFNIWRDNIGVVPQEIDLMNGSIIENIAPGDDNPDLSKIVDIITALNLSELIEGLPYGIKTSLGDMGRGLSRGERQRVAIARVLYRDPSIIILDEATSSLDQKSADIVRSVIKAKNSIGKTIVMVTHNTDDIAIADKTVYL